MSKSLAKILIPAILLLVLVFILNKSWGIVPPIGKLLNPFTGFINNNNSTELPEILFNEFYSDTVKIIWDEREVPHIYAQNESDLYRAQGYITAFHRLFQMDIQTRAAGGRLSEIFGERAFEYDKYMRRLGMVYAAENSLNSFLANDTVSIVLNSFRDGINDFISELSEKNFPIEYKIFDFEPEKWTNLRTALLLKMMALDLSGYNRELNDTQLIEFLGEDLYYKIYPSFSKYNKPIIEDKYNLGVDNKLKNTEKGKSNFKNSEINFFETSNKSIDPFLKDNYNNRAINGSNNWAVSGKKTKSGNPLLANDPHLSLTLPSIWYEIQLISPNSNVYGVSLPGAPGIIIGFNEDIAWGVTNAGSDAFDWYKLELPDTSYSNYILNGAVKEFSKRIERIKIKDKIIEDTVFYSIFGPLVYRKGEKPFRDNIPVDCAMRWLAHDESLEPMTFYLLNRAKNYNDYLNALKYYDCPAQNFAFISKANEVALRHNGKYPIREMNQGRFIQSGNTVNNYPQKFIPFEELPSSKNPSNGFVFSANQYPVGEDYPYYLGSDYATFERGYRINELLENNDSIDIEFMKSVQADILNPFAEKLMPIIKKHIDKENLSDSAKIFLEYLYKWDFRAEKDEKAVQIFELFWDEIYNNLWLKFLVNNNDTLLFPKRDITLEILDNSTNFPEIMDKVSIKELFNNSLENTVDLMKIKYGDKPTNWNWGKTRNTEIKHVGMIPQFGINNLRVSGSYNTVNANRGTHGPSWKMIVELGDSINAYGIYPGGQTGNPGSERYSEFVKDWSLNKYYKLVYLNIESFESGEKIEK